MKNTHLFLIWLVLNLLIVAGMDLALFAQTRPGMKDASFFEKLKVTEFWATVQWLFIIPANTIAKLFLTVPQISLSSFFFDFLGQLFSNKFWLKIPTTLDDYAAIVLFMLALYIAKFTAFG
jgi:hypothetical protein